MNIQVFCHGDFVWSLSKLDVRLANVAPEVLLQLDKDAKTK